MINLFTQLTLFIIVLSFFGCSSLGKDEIIKEEFRIDLNATKEAQRKPAIEIIEVSRDNFNIEKSPIPDMETITRVKILGAQFDDVIALLTEATGQDIIFQLQSNGTGGNNNQNNLAGATGVTGVTGVTGDSSDVAAMRESKVYLSASNIGFGRLLNKMVGDKISIGYADETYYIGFLKTVTLKIPSVTGLSDAITKTLTTFGAISIAHDPITSSITFSAREKEYQDIMNYLTILRNNLYVIEYDIAIYDVELKDNYALGIDWNLLASGSKGMDFSTTSSSIFGSVAAAVAPATFGAILDIDKLSGVITGEALTQFGKVESIQKPKLLGIAGTDVVLIDGLNEPYIKELTTTIVGDNSTQTSTVSASALSGLKITLNSNIMDNTVLTNIALEINDIVGFTNFSVDGTSYSQPRVHTKNITNSIRVQPGVPIVIAGLFRNKSDKGYSGIPGLDDTQAKLLGGSEFDGGTKSEMVIIVTPRVIKYVMK